MKIPNLTFTEQSVQDFLVFSKAGNTIECEIKISLSDFRADKKKVAKHNFYKMGIQCPNYFIYVCAGFEPPHEEIPDFAGLGVLKFGESKYSDVELIEWELPDGFKPPNQRNYEIRKQFDFLKIKPQKLRNDKVQIPERKLTEAFSYRYWNLRRNNSL